MPTYEYKCTGCDVIFDEFQSITADPLTDCPKCKKKNVLKRLIGGGAGILFKGSGFYQTDYRSSSYQKGAEKEKKSSPSTAEKKTTKKKPS
jgi:putative FmdB family regulatory protein